MSNKNKIQIDMFDVQLGSALLLQMSSEDNHIVRIIADAGINSSVYSRNTVSQKLPSAFKCFNNHSEESPWTIDLLIGTHYDKDHIYGLTSIVNDDHYKITEAWLPTVVNDTQIHTEETSIEEASLGAQLIKNDNKKILKSYLEYHDTLCKWTSYWIHEIRGQERKESETQFRHESELDSESPKNEIIKRFMGYQQEANRILDTSLGKEWNDDIIKFSNDFMEHFKGMSRHPKRYWHRYAFQDLWDDFMFEDRSHTLKYLAFIQKGSAKNAINATYLNELIQALKRKKIPIKYHSIDQGNPETFYFDGKNFTKHIASGPIITLLGPSKELITKHIDKIPVFQGLFFNIKHTVPSNELSYVLVIEHLEQTILVTGDSGFRDFKPFSQQSKKYYQAILNHLNTLHVIQIAHHGGINGFFYEALNQAGYTQNKKTKSYHLLSHEFNSNSRPSQEYLDFFNTMKKNNCDFEIVFTSQPQNSKLQILQTNKAPCTSSNANKSGDAQVVYDGSNWKITKHMI